MGVEIADADSVLAADERGVPRKTTNMRDLENAAQLPPRKVYVPCPPGYSHGNPPHINPYKPSSTEEEPDNG